MHPLPLVIPPLCPTASTLALDGEEIEAATYEGGYLSKDDSDLAALDRLRQESRAEALAERLHWDEGFPRMLNPSNGCEEGETILVTDSNLVLEGAVAGTEVLKSLNWLAAFDARGTIIANCRVSVGLSESRLLSGTDDIVGAAPKATYAYDLPISDKTASLLPFEGPMGLVWVDLSKPIIGLHGTAHPSQLLPAKGHCCVGVTNWASEELASMVQPGTVGEFIKR